MHLLIAFVIIILTNAISINASLLFPRNYTSLARSAKTRSDNIVSIGRRWHTILQDDSGNLLGHTRRWPQSTIPYCFRDGNSKTQLQQIVKAGWKIWQSRGGPKNADMGEYKDCPAYPVPLSTKYLVIEVNHRRFLDTTIGWASKVNDIIPGNWMQFDPDPTVAMGNPDVNMAHEIGHAWGFYHEQQRRDAWDRAANPGIAHADGDKNQLSFRCENLRDYDESRDSIGEEATNKACRDYELAQRVRFRGAQQYLPLPWAAEFGPRDELDWSSIMLYGSEIGAKSINNVKQNVYVRYSDGKKIENNLVPSASDVQRFKALYSARAPNPNPCLINQECNPRRGMFYQTIENCKNIIK